MEAATYLTLLRLRLPPADANSDGSHGSWMLPRVQELSSILGRVTTGDGSHGRTCALNIWKQECYSKDGDVLIGASLAVHAAHASSEPTFTEEPRPLSCEGFYIRYYRVVLAMVFAIEEINQTPDFLPNITLGFRIFDSCISEKQALRGTLELLSGKVGAVPGYSCSTRPLVAGILGETLSSLTIPMARILGVLHYPQISHSASISTLSDKLQFPSFLRTLPGNTVQNVALAQLIGHFGWSWVGMVISDDDVGLQGGQQVKKLIEENGGCVAFMERIHLRYSMEKVWRVFNVIRRHSVKVVIILSAAPQVKLLLEIIYDQNVTGKTWIFSAYFRISPGLFACQAWRILNGTLGLKPFTNTISGFEDFLLQLHPGRFPGDIFFRRFWEKTFSCRWLENTTMELEHLATQVVSCSGNETMAEIGVSMFELNDLSFTYQVYLAVHALAHAVNTLINCIPGQGPFTNGTCAYLSDIHHWQILHYLKNQQFKTRSGHEIFFDENGDPPPFFDIMNFGISEDEGFQLLKVGSIDPRDPRGKDISISSGSILWSDGSSEVPRSLCSESCPPGYRKAPKEGKPVCCFDCVLCSQGEISNGTDKVKCIKCPDDQWPNERHDECIQKVVEFLSYEEPLGVLLSVSASTLTLLTALILLVFIKYRATPIAKANNRGLSYLLLVALMFCFLCSFMFIGRPKKLTCQLRQAVFGVIFTISVSAVLTKTIIVVIAFKATNPSSAARRWLGFRRLCWIIFLSCLLQVLICVAWLLTHPPYPELNMKSYNEKIIFECNEGDPIFFYCMLGYMGLLATVSFIVAFVSRNLPGSFNEAKLITFSMLMFVSVWISFIPAYLSTRGKYMVAVEVFAILCSSAGLLGCIFFPKCYIILLRPSANIREHVTGRASSMSKKKK
ncbi:extracellular calcium-sensing receptor-like [Pleurodeles waltl]|uniref:extracellular calcium-sensing receptor-like n=1 Tax=Pleurodeles waltl TaxID=8319 RepID=UPI0037098B46